MALTTSAGGRGRIRRGIRDPFKLTLLAAVLVAALPVNEHLVQQAELFADSPEWHDSFGRRVGISSDTIVVGAFEDDTAAGEDAGSAYVFTRAGATWSKQQQLFASDAVAGDFFGYSVAISGDTIAVGAPWDNSSVGSVYVFTRSGTTWSQQDHLLSPSVTGLGFGYTLAISGDTIVTGMPYDNNETGSAYVFTRSGDSWSQQQNLVASDGVSYDQFGQAVAISGDTIVVGAPWDAGGGSAYVFTRSGITWSEQGHLYGSDVVSGDELGWGVAIFGDTIVVGVEKDDTAAGADAGSAYVFTRSDSTWSQQDHLFAGDGAAGDYFGNSVAIASGMIVVGAIYDNTAAGQTGSAYVFTQSGGTWSQQSRLLGKDAGAGGHFGCFVSISGGTVVVGAQYDSAAAEDAGSAYVFGPPFLDYFIGEPDLLPRY
jgi:hypothetical protein